MRSKKQSGGRIAFPLEFYDSTFKNAFSENANANVCKNAYGDTLPYDQGRVHEGGKLMGANLHVSPNSTGLQTGGRRRGRGRSRDRTRTKRRRGSSARRRRRSARKNSQC
jgi:hypothetical protein